MFKLHVARGMLPNSFGYANCSTFAKRQTWLRDICVTIFSGEKKNERKRFAKFRKFEAAAGRRSLVWAPTSKLKRGAAETKTEMNEK